MAHLYGVSIPAARSRPSIFFAFDLVLRYVLNVSTGAGAEGRAMCGPTIQCRKAYRGARRGGEALDGHRGKPNPRHGQAAGRVQRGQSSEYTNTSICPECPGL